MAGELRAMSSFLTGADGAEVEGVGDEIESEPLLVRSKGVPAGFELPKGFRRPFAPLAPFICGTGCGGACGAGESAGLFLLPPNLRVIFSGIFNLILAIAGSGTTRFASATVFLKNF